MSRYLLSLMLSLVLLKAGPVLASMEARPTGQPSSPPEANLHVVGRGETLASIAQRYGSTVEALAHANGLYDPTRVHVGQRLVIPGPGADIDPESTTGYVVQPGDSLVNIAMRHGMRWRDLAWLNVMLSPDTLFPGQVIQVPTPEDDRGSYGRLHRIGKGETLFHIASLNAVPPYKLLEANGLANAALTYEGQSILLPGVGRAGLPEPFASVDVQPLPVSQGGVLVVAVRAEDGATLTGTLLERPIRFADEGGVLFGLAGVHVFTDPGPYELTLRAIDRDGSATELTIDVIVEDAHYGYERLGVSPSLLDPAVVAAERERLDALRTRFTSERAWIGPFEPPCGGTVSSYFGTRRAYNEGPYTSYHAGVDLRGTTGTPVYAPAAGTVVMADQLTVRGNAVMVDHGWGVLTGYWHLSNIEVELGQRVEQGDLLARIGNTGLSTGSHLHWEMWVGGVDVNPLRWLAPLYPWPEPATGPGGMQ